MNAPFIMRTALLTSALLTLTGCAVSSPEPAAEAAAVQPAPAAAESSPAVPICANESVLPYAQGILASDFGCDLKRDLPGFVQYRERGLSQYAVAPGQLKQPTGMALYDKYLLIADRENVKVYDLDTDLTAAAAVIAFPADEHYLNDLTVMGDTLFATSVENDRVYTVKLSADALAAGTSAQPQLFAALPGPNGICTDGTYLYAACIPHDYKTVQPEHVVYRLDPEDGSSIALTSRPGLYDGIAVVGDRLFISDWRSASIEEINLTAGIASTFFQQDGLTPADIAADPARGVLYIPDMLHQRILTVSLADGTELEDLPEPDNVRGIF